MGPCHGVEAVDQVNGAEGEVPDALRLWRGAPNGQISNRDVESVVSLAWWPTPLTRDGGKHARDTGRRIWPNATSDWLCQTHSVAVN